MKFERNKKNFETLERFNASLYEEVFKPAAPARAGAPALIERQQKRLLPAVPTQKMHGGVPEAIKAEKKRQGGMGRPFSAPVQTSAEIGAQPGQQFAIYEDMAKNQAVVPNTREVNNSNLEGRPRPPPRPNNSKYLKLRPNSRPLAKGGRNCRPSTATPSTGCTTTASSRRLRPRPVNHMHHR